MSKKDNDNDRLVYILTQLLASDTPATHKLERGLYLAYTPPGEERPYRLVCSRKNKYPSEHEDRTIIIALKDAFPRAFPGLTLVNLELAPMQRHLSRRYPVWYGFTIFTWQAARQLSLLEQDT